MNSALEVVDRQRWLAGLADAVQPVVRELLENSGALKDVLHGKFLGHPLHPVLVDIPTGSWTAAAVCDAFELMSGSDALASAADFSVAFGLAGALGSTAASLGGPLVFGEQIGVDHTATADRGEPEKFTAVARESELEERKPK